MATEEQTTFWLCEDCMTVACTGHDGPEMRDSGATWVGLAMLGYGLVSGFDGDTGDGIRTFACIPCASCLTARGDRRYQFTRENDHE